MRRGAGRDAKHALELGTGDAKIAGFAVDCFVTVPPTLFPQRAGLLRLYYRYGAGYTG